MRLQLSRNCLADNSEPLLGFPTISRRAQIFFAEYLQTRSKETDSAESVHLSNLCSRHLPHIVHRERHMDAPIRGDRGDASKLANPPICGRPHSNTCVRKAEIAVIERSVRLAVPKDPAKGQCMQRVCWV